MSKARPMWACGECGELHASLDGANDCCRPVASLRWVCAKCGESYQTEAAAEDCCNLAERDK